MELKKETVSTSGILNPRNDGNSGKEEPLAIRSWGQGEGALGRIWPKVLKSWPYSTRNSGAAYRPGAHHVPENQVTATGIKPSQNEMREGWLLKSVLVTGIKFSPGLPEFSAQR